MKMKQLKTWALVGAAFLAVACGKDDSDGPYYKFRSFAIETEQPNTVNLLFQVRNSNSIGVTDLVTDDFYVKENGEELNAYESDFTVEHFVNAQILKTVLLVDISKSVEPNLDGVKAALTSFVNSKATYQQIAIYTFSSNSEKLIDFTSSKADLRDAIASIQIGTSSTNLYGSIINCSDLWDDEFTLESVEVGNLIVLVDGNENQDSYTLDEAIDAVEGRSVYMLGVGTDYDPGVMRKLGDYYAANTIEKLESQILAIQDAVLKESESIYHAHYNSPKRGPNTHELRLYIRGNGNGGTTGRVEGEFDSTFFDDE